MFQFKNCEGKKRALKKKDSAESEKADKNISGAKEPETYATCTAKDAAGIWGISLRRAQKMLPELPGAFKNRFDIWEAPFAAVVGHLRQRTGRPWKGEKWVDVNSRNGLVYRKCFLRIVIERIHPEAESKVEAETKTAEKTKKRKTKTAP